MSDQDGGAVVCILQEVQTVNDFLHVVAVNFLHIPTKGLPFCWDVKHPHLGFTEVIVLDSVSVQNNVEVAQFVVCCGHGRFQTLP